MGKNILTKELLLRSVEEWNTARKAHPDLKPDLHDEVLCGANLCDADLSMADLHRTNLSMADLRKAHMYDANLNMADLTGTKLNEANLTGAVLIEADLSNAILTGTDLICAILNGAKLNEANLTGATLISADLSNAILRSADLSKANLREVNLLNADLSKANLSRAHIYEANLNKTDFYRAVFNGANLHSSVFNEANLTGACMNRASIGNTVFVNVDLSQTNSLESVWHHGPSTIGIDTIYKSKGNIPEVFLRGCGVPENFIENIRALTMNPIDFYSCFISYSTNNDDFANRIHNDLQASGVRCWFAPHDIQGGKKVLHQIEEAIRVYDKLLLILSPDSMNSNWVEQEIINAIQKEQQQKKLVLFPISIVPFEEIKKWKRFDSDSGRDLAREIREYHIPDFSLWGSDQTAYKKAFDLLLKDLKQ